MEGSQESMPHIFATVILMIVAGILGSKSRAISDSNSVRTEHDENPGRTSESWASIATPGIAASFVVPLFLSISKSGVMENVVAGKDYAQNAFILFSFCVLAAATSRNFIESIAKKALQVAKDAADVAAEAKDLASEEPTSLPKSKSTSDDNTHQNFLKKAHSAEERAVLSTLMNEEYTRRSLTGVASSAKLSKNAARAALLELVRRGLVAEIQSTKTGNLLYQLKLENHASEASESAFSPG